MQIVQSIKQKREASRVVLLAEYSSLIQRAVRDGTLPAADVDRIDVLAAQLGVPVESIGKIIADLQQLAVLESDAGKLAEAEAAVQVACDEVATYRAATEAEIAGRRAGLSAKVRFGNLGCGAADEELNAINRYADLRQQESSEIAQRASNARGAADRLRWAAEEVKRIRSEHSEIIAAMPTPTRRKK